MDILDSVKPSYQEEKESKRIVNKFLKMLNKNLKDSKAVVGGSFAKGTWLMGDHDVDIFVKYKSNKNISEKLYSSLKKMFKEVKRVHGSRDYYVINFHDYIFEVVPVLEIKNYRKAENVTDVSPLHASYVKKNVDKPMLDEIRILKQFCKCNRLYGAESHIKGFSGYVLELLIIHYKTFNNLIRKAAKWGDGLIIDIESNYKSKDDILNSLSQSKRSCMIIVDPIQKDRNVSAALSLQNYKKFTALCSKYLNNPNQRFFRFEEFNPRKHKKDLVLEVKLLSGRKDVSGSKAIKAYRFILNKLNEAGFSVKSSGYFLDNQSYFWFDAKKNISKYAKHIGPFARQGLDVEKFKKKWSDHKVMVSKNRVYIKKKRDYDNLEDFVSVLIKDTYLNDKISLIKVIDSEKEV